MSSSARVIVIGGGAFGTSIAFHLAEQGIKDVLLVDRFGLADGTTWHSGGFLGQLRSEIPIMQLIARSASLYNDLAGREPGELDWHQVGSLRLATTTERMQEFNRLATLANRAGVPASLIDPDEVRSIAPQLETNDLVGAVWIPTDGYVEPDTLPKTLARHAEREGVTIKTAVEVTGIATRGNSAIGVHTAEGLIEAEQIVVAAGFATPTLLATAGVFVPIAVSRQQYLITEDVPSDLSNFPTIREPDRSQYFRRMGKKILLGAIAGEAGITLPEEMPHEARFLFEPLEHGLDAAWEGCQQRVPALQSVAIERIVRGPEGVTPDGELIIDETPVQNLWLAAGGCGHGIAAAGGVGWHTAALVANRLDPRLAGPTVDGGPFALDRFPASFQSDTAKMLAVIEQCEVGHYQVVETPDPVT